MLVTRPAERSTVRNHRKFSSIRALTANGYNSHLAGNRPFSRDAHPGRSPPWSDNVNDRIHEHDRIVQHVPRGSRHCRGVQCSSHTYNRINQFGVVESPPLAAARTLTYHRMHTHTATNIGFVDASASRSPPLSARRGHHTCTLAASRLCIHRRRRHPRGRHLQLRSTTV